MSIEAMKQALEALEVAANGGGVNFYEYAKDLEQAIAEAEKQPKREWVGLTDEERNQVMQDKTWMHMEGLCQAIETKLKKKNNG